MKKTAVILLALLVLTFTATAQDSCQPLWECSWSDCENGVQTRACIFDRNRCGGDPPTTQQRICEADLSREISTVASEEGLEGAALPDIVEQDREVTALQIIILAIGGLIIVVGILIALTTKKKKEAVHGKTAPHGQTQPLKKTKEIKELEGEAEKAVKEGKTTGQMKKELTEQGGKKKDVDKIVMFTKAKAYINYQMKKGVAKEEIIKQLKAKKWGDKVIQQLFRELK